MPELTQDQVIEILDKCYNEAVNGLAKSKNCVDLASEYLNWYPNTEIAVKTMINNQIAMYTTSGFLTSLGGLITLPIALPANLVSVWYMQIRMIGTNINQLARRVNQGGMVPTLHELYDLSNKLNEIKRDVNSNISFDIKGEQHNGNN